MAVPVRTTDLLQVSTDFAPAGANWHDNRTAWHGLGEFTLTTTATPGSLWYQDQGPIGLDPALAEPRAFCFAGAASFSFTGRTLWMRLNVAWSWFSGATITIDGLAPTAIPGVLPGARDTLSCDAATYGLTADGYVDVLVADGLADTTHAVAISVVNTDPAKFFSVAGFKVGFLASQRLQLHPQSIVDMAALPVPNRFRLTLTNQSANPVANIAASFPTGVLSITGTDPAPAIDAALLGPAEALEAQYLIDWAGGEASGDYSKTILLSAFYNDPAGSTVIVVPIEIAADSPTISFAPAPWFMDTATPSGAPRRHTSTRTSGGTPNVLQFPFDGDSIDVTIQQSAGWGLLGVYSAPAGSLLHTLDCSVDVGGALATVTLAGFGPGAHTLYLRKIAEDGLPVVFVAATWDRADTFTQVTETVALDYAAAQAIPLRPTGVVIGDYDAVFDVPDQTAIDYSEQPLRTNADVEYTEVLTRFPTFAVCYQSGYRDVLADYDVLIVDPIGAKPADVAYWQSLGIKVFGYVSSGEEVGFYENPYDFGSGLAPRKDGTGPGGFSSNYMFTKNPAAGPPDKNGVWASYYMDPRPASGWLDRILDYYMPQVFGGPEVIVDEVVTVSTAQMNDLSWRYVFQTAKAPFDDTADITVRTSDHVTTYARYRDYTYDKKSGRVVFAASLVPPVTDGQVLHVSYTRLGHDFDGVFWDTCDTPDVYSGPEFGYEYVPGYAEAFADMLLAVKAAYPAKRVIFNRGFTILADIIEAAEGGGVMFETWLTAPDDISDMANTDYHRITDPESVAYNEAANDLLLQLRTSHVFDVYSLNYAKPDDLELKQYIQGKDHERGYLSWQTIITLQNPNRLTTIDTPGPPVNTNAYAFYKRRGAAVLSIWDAGASIWDDGTSIWVG